MIVEVVSQSMSGMSDSDAVEENKKVHSDNDPQARSTLNEFASGLCIQLGPRLNLRDLQRSLFLLCSALADVRSSPKHALATHGLFYAGQPVRKHL